MSTAGSISRDNNFQVAQGAVSSASDTGTSALPLQYNPTTRGLTVHIVGNGPGALTIPTIDSYSHIPINLSAGTDQLLVSSAANKQIWVYGVAFTLSVDGSVSFQDEDNTAVTGIMPFAQFSGLGLPPSDDLSMPIWKLATNKDLEVDVVTADIDGWLDYAIVSV